MYFVTSKRPGYCLFSMTPSERAAIALTDAQDCVHVLERTGTEWRIRQQWPVAERSHTEVMVQLGGIAEPATVDELLKLVQTR